MNESRGIEEHLKVLRLVTRRLGKAATLAEVGVVIAGEMRQSIGASRVVLLIEDDDGGWRDLVTGERSTLAPPPSGWPIWLTSTDAVARAFPDLHGLSSHAAAVLPLVIRDRRLGALLLGFPVGRSPGVWERAVGDDLALQAAQAIDRLILAGTAERAVLARDELFAMLGHELRNPLSAILTAAQIMRMRDEEHCAKERAIIERQTQGLVRMIDDLLDVARIAGGRLGLARRSVDLAAIIAAAVDQARPALEAGGHPIEIAIPDGVSIHADLTRMAQAFANLLDNAAKYSPVGGRIEISAALGDGGVSIAVRDQGAGIAPELLPRVFDAFVQGRRRDRPQSGLGLGLAIARAIVGLHGGTIRAASAGPERGSEFIVELPFSAAEQGAAAGPAEPEAVAAADRLGSARPTRLLLVDDNEDGASMLALWLAKHGHDVRVAYDPETALSIAREFRPDVAVLDIGLPGMDGYQLAAALRALRPEATLRLIALTGYGQAADRSRSAAAGFNAHLVKPVELSVFQAAIAGHGCSTAA